MTNLFQSTHPLRGATRFCARMDGVEEISIHAPLAGCDLARALVDARHAISIHAPLAGCDGFDPERSMHRADFNPRTPCGVRLHIHRGQ